jgi:ABC-2 type transport system permease protein
MIGVTYTRYELLRSFRNARFLFFSVMFPVILYFVLAAPNRNENNFGNSGISAPLYYMVGLVSFGTMVAMISTGARISGDRQAGWTRQLRISPLRASAYFQAKVLTAYAMAFLTIGLLYVCGTSIGVRLPLNHWLAMTGLILIALLPFAALGILLGHLLTVDSMGPATGGVTSLLALVSGTWFPIGNDGFVHDLAQLLPSYWLVQASHVSLGGGGWTSTGWEVVAAWTVVLTVLARLAYQRDTGRV